MPPYVWAPPDASVCSNNPHMSPMLPCASACTGGICMWMGDVGPSFCLDTPHMFGCLPMCPTPPCIYMLPCLSVCSRGYCMNYGGTSNMLGDWGASAHLSGFCCLSVHPWDLHYASSCTFLVVYYVSSLYFHCCDYYSSSDCGVFWYVISMIDDHGSLFDGDSYNVGSAWCGSATTPDIKRFCATAATSIFDASSGLCQLCHGFSTGRFLFQSWASNHFA